MGAWGRHRVRAALADLYRWGGLQLGSQVIKSVSEDRRERVLWRGERAGGEEREGVGGHFAVLRTLRTLEGRMGKPEEDMDMGHI